MKRHCISQKQQWKRKVAYFLGKREKSPVRRWRLAL
jgi:hypothetical protein